MNIGSEFWMIDRGGMLHGPYGGTQREIFGRVERMGAVSAVRVTGVPRSYTYLVEHSAASRLGGKIDEHV